MAVFQTCDEKESVVGLQQDRVQREQYGSLFVFGSGFSQPLSQDSQSLSQKAFVNCMNGLCKKKTLLDCNHVTNRLKPQATPP